MRANFAAYGLLDDQTRFLPGWFRDTMPRAPVERLALLRLDGDMYESTMIALENLYPRVSIGGYVIVDDYCIASCAKAVNDYRARTALRMRSRTLTALASIGNGALRRVSHPMTARGWI